MVTDNNRVTGTPVKASLRDGLIKVKRSSKAEFLIAGDAGTHIPLQHSPECAQNCGFKRTTEEKNTL